VKRRRGGVIEATVFALAGMAMLAGLGIWQLDRKVWKEHLVATLDARLSRPPAPLPPREAWPRLTAAADEYSRVTFPAQFIAGESALVYTAGSAFRPDISGAGYWVFAPARLSGGSVVVVNRGFVPLERIEASREVPQCTLDLVGVLRWPEKPGMFTPNDEPQNNVWYTRDQKAISATKSWDAPAPFYVELEAPAPTSGLPKPGRLLVALPDNHLQYALTWFGLALALGGVYVTWLARRLRLRRA